MLEANAGLRSLLASAAQAACERSRQLVQHPGTPGPARTGKGGHCRLVVLARHLRTLNLMASQGSGDIPVVCAGQLIHAGDVVLADDDGVVIVRRDELTAVIDASRKRANLEEQKRLRLAAGELGLDIYNMRARLEEKGLKYYDSLDQLRG